MTDDPGDDVLEAQPLRIRRWHAVVIAVVVVLAGGIQVARHAHHSAPAAVPAATLPAPPSASPAPEIRAIQGQAVLSNVVGNRCPTSVVCGIGLRVSAGMEARFRKDFPGSVISLQASAFDAGEPKTYWQQINATAPNGVQIVLTQQRQLRPPAKLGGVVVTPTADGTEVSVTEYRGAWRLIAGLTRSSTAPFPLAAARHWVTATPLPR